MLHIKIIGITKCSNKVANIFPAAPPPPTHTHLTLRSRGQNSILSEHGHVAYQIKWNHKIKQHDSKYFAHRHPNHLTFGSKGKNSIFSEHGHAANKILLESQKVATSWQRFCPQPPSPPLTLGSKFNCFITMSCSVSKKRESQMQLHGSKCCACRPPPLNHGDGSIAYKSTFSDHGHVADQIKRNHTILLQNPHTLTLEFGSKCQNSTFRIWSCSISN